MSTLTKFDRPTLPDLLWSTWPFGPADGELALRDAMAMRVEQRMDGDTMVVRAELPGIDPDKDVSVTLDHGLLTIAAERRESSTEGEKGKPGYRTEFVYGSFRRVVRVPEGTREDDVTATYTDGILEIRLPMAAAPAEPTTVPVTRS